MRDFAALLTQVCRSARALHGSLEPWLTRQFTGLASKPRPLGFEALQYSSKNNIDTHEGCLYCLVRHEGLEPPTFAFVVRDSIQLS